MLISKFHITGQISIYFHEMGTYFKQVFWDYGIIFETFLGFLGSLWSCMESIDSNQNVFTASKMLQEACATKSAHF